jgi:hypothetical protein
MQNIERGIPIAFITHRRISEGYEKATENHRLGILIKLLKNKG